MSILKMNFSLRKVYSSDIKFHLCKVEAMTSLYNRTSVLSSAG